MPSGKLTAGRQRLLQNGASSLAAARFVDAPAAVFFAAFFAVFLAAFFAPFLAAVFAGFFAAFFTASLAAFFAGAFLAGAFFAPPEITQRPPQRLAGGASRLGK